MYRCKKRVTIAKSSIILANKKSHKKSGNVKNTGVRYKKYNQAAI
jgi:hypothetical protein